jgi:hypothetical protein
VGYLEAAEFEIYGLPAETADAWVTAASSLVDAHCRRSAGGLLAAQYVERLRVGRSQVVQLSYLPVAAVTGIRARMMAGRDDLGGRYEVLDAQNLVLETFFGAGQATSWTVFDPTQADLNALTGELTPPVNLFGARYVEVEVTYTAGYTDAPAAVKVAVAQIVRNMQAQVGGNVRSSKVDTLQLEYFSGSYVDETVRTLLVPYVASRMG